uniref:C-type lectin domain-containing protein n=1 Tax=Sphaeramia orbicularis TaxID=375764 RepID=A0A673A532_9TELE
IFISPSVYTVACTKHHTGILHCIDFFFFLTSSFAGMSCETGWSKFGMNCYYDSVTELDWVHSRLVCLSMGADLVSINTAEEQAFINGLLSPQVNAWIGLNDIHSEGKWKWVDGTAVTTTFWGPGQPNSYNGTNQDCGELVENSLMGQWNDEDCSAENIWICEK